jgi:hypothetical protein
MRFNKIKALIMGLSLGAMLFVGVGSITAQAQRRIVVRRGPVIVRPHWGYRSYWGPGWGPYWGPTVTVVNPIAQARESGYRDGHSRGKDDAKDGKPNAPDSHKHFRNSDSQTYRQAFLQGYADGYREQIGRLG